MSILLEQKQALIAGDGQLPVKMAENATKNGLEVICISLSNDNTKDLKKVCSKVYSVGAGELLKIKKILQKGLQFCNPFVIMLIVEITNCNF